MLRVSVYEPYGFCLLLTYMVLGMWSKWSFSFSLPSNLILTISISVNLSYLPYTHFCSAFCIISQIWLLIYQYFYSALPNLCFNQQRFFYLTILFFIFESFIWFIFKYYWSHRRTTYYLFIFYFIFYFFKYFIIIFFIFLSDKSNI